MIALSAIYWRSEWKYRARAYRYCYWDAGTLLANLLAAAAGEEISAEVITAFEDPALETLLGIDGDREGMIALVALGRTDEPAAQSPAVEPLALETIPLSSREVEYQDLIKIHRESRLVTPEEVAAVAAAKWDSQPTVLGADALHLETITSEESAGLGETILRRGSSRAFAQAAITAAELATIMAASSEHPQADFPPLTDTYLIVNAADGMEPGAYYYNRHARAFELLKAGNFRGEAGYLCLEQPLGMDCSALIVYMADLERTLQCLWKSRLRRRASRGGNSWRARLPGCLFARPRRDGLDLLRRRHDQIFRAACCRKEPAIDGRGWNSALVDKIVNPKRAVSFPRLDLFNLSQRLIVT